MNERLVRRLIGGAALAYVLQGAAGVLGRAAADAEVAAVRGEPRPRNTCGLPEAPPFRTQRLFGMSVADVTSTGAITRIIAWSQQTPARTIFTANLDHALKLTQDPVFARAYAAADMVTADGQPLVRLSRHENTPLDGVVTGSDLIKPLAAAAAREGRSIFLFGSTHDRLHKAAEALKDENPNLSFAGLYAPPMGFEQDEATRAEVLHILRTVRPDIVLVALGAPKQEIWAHEMANSVRHGVFVCIGAGLDFLSGETVRAPGWTRQIGMEWLWRALTEPRRLGPRYARIIWHLPALYRRHKRDRAAHAAAERRAAIARAEQAPFADLRAAARREDRAAGDTDRAG